MSITHLQSTFFAWWSSDSRGRFAGHINIAKTHPHQKHWAATIGVCSLTGNKMQMNILKFKTNLSLMQKSIYTCQWFLIRSALHTCSCADQKLFEKEGKNLYKH